MLTYIALLVISVNAHPTRSPQAQGLYSPAYYQVGASSTIDGFQNYAQGSITLDSNSPVLTLDYGVEVAGFPFVEITSVTGLDAQIEMKYSEPFDGLALPYGDGPWLYTNGLMNSFRTETFNITIAGKTESFFLQGGLRWQTITLLTNSSLTIGKIGISPSVDIKQLADLVGSFSTSNSTYSDVWALGARAVQAACVDANSQPSTWEVTSDGTLVRGQYPAVSAKGTLYGNYTMSFSTKVVTGGTGWRVAGGANGGYGPYFVMTTDDAQLVNQNSTLLPKNSLTAGFGFSIINESILSSAPIQQFNIPFTILNGEWYRISTTINATGYDISINDTHVAFVPSGQWIPYINPSWGTTSVTDGTWGFGPFQDQAAYLKDVQVVATNGSTIYTNALTTDEVYKEYAIASNSYAVCLDGAKRDRDIWIGDFVHTARELAVSSGRYDFIQSMIEFEFDWQFLSGPEAGLVPIQALPGAGYEYRSTYYSSQFGEQDYPFFFLVTLGDYFRLTSDTTLLGKHWTGIKLLVDSQIESYLDPVSGLMAGESAFWFTAQGTQNATAPTALFAIALNQLATVATALNDSSTAAYYVAISQNISTSINTQLWSSELGSYGLSLTEPNETSILATAYTIRAGIANSSQASSAISKLADLFYQIGYKDSSTISNSATTQLSPNVQGFLLESLFLANKQINVSSTTIVPVLKNLFELYWPSMVNQNQYYTGCSWEYVYPDGSPGIGIFTSLCHPWGGAPTYIMSDYILGVRRELNVTTGLYEWVFDPAWDVLSGLGLTYAEGRVPLFGGGYIEASWTVSSTGEIDYKVDVLGAQVVDVVVKHPSSGS